MGIFTYHIGKMDIPEEHREEYARQALKLLRAGGMMTVEELRLYRKKIYLLSPPEFDEEGRATGYYNYFEKECWEDWWLSTKRGTFRKKGDTLSERVSPFISPEKRKGCALDLPLFDPAMPMLHALRKALPAHFCSGFRSGLLLAPLRRSPHRQRSLFADRLDAFCPKPHRSSFPPTA